MGPSVPDSAIPSVAAAPPPMKLRRDSPVLTESACVVMDVPRPLDVPLTSSDSHDPGEAVAATGLLLRFRISATATHEGRHDGLSPLKGDVDACDHHVLHVDRSVTSRGEAAISVCHLRALDPLLRIDVTVDEVEIPPADVGDPHRDRDPLSQEVCSIHRDQIEGRRLGLCW